MHVRDGVSAKRMQHTDFQCRHIQLEERARVVQRRPLGIGFRRGELQQLVGGDRDVLEDRGAGAGGPLAEAVPVVEHGYPVAVGGHQRDDRGVVRVAGQHLGVVGVQRAGGEELLPVEPVGISVLGELGLPDETAGGLGAEFGRGVTTMAPTTPDRRPLPVVAGEAQPFLHMGKMATQNVRDVDIGGRKRDDGGEQFAQAGTASAVCRRDAQRTEALLADPVDDRERAVVGAFTLQRAFADLGKQRGQACGPVGQRFVAVDVIGLPPG